MSTHEKIENSGNSITLSVDEAGPVVSRILGALGCSAATTMAVTDHLIDAELCGVASHGLVRILQYAEQFASGYMQAAAEPELVETARGVVEVSGHGGIGIPAMQLAIEHACAKAKADGMAIVPVRDVGHTGRLGAFAEVGADTGCLIMIIGGGARQRWRQVAPYGGRKAVLPTNPYCMAIPGGERGPVVIDFATSMVAGGWLIAARQAGSRMAEGLIVDAEGRPSRDPEAYFAGGAILPKGGPMGYGLAVIAELIGEAMLGPATTEVNWLTLAIDSERYRAPAVMRQVAEEILAELRSCPPADGFERVEVPGEREREKRRIGRQVGISIPARTWTEIAALARGLADKP